ARQIRPGGGLAEALAPYLLGREHRLEIASLLLLRAIGQDRGPRPGEADRVDEERRACARHLLGDDARSGGIDAASPVLLGHVEAEVACVVHIALPAPEEVELLRGLDLEERLRQLEARRRRAVTGDESAHFAAERVKRGRLGDR